MAEMEYKVNLSINKRGNKEMTCEGTFSIFWSMVDSLVSKLSIREEFSAKKHLQCTNDLIPKSIVVNPSAE